MRVLIVFAHPEAASFNGAMLRVAIATLEAEGHEVQVSDLYAEGFNPVAGRHDFQVEKQADFFKLQAEQQHAAQAGTFSSDLSREQQRLLWCDLVIFQFPLWWYSVPAILKGWFDRVLAFGFAYGNGKWFEHGPLGPRRAMLAMTAGAPQQRYVEGAILGDITHVLYPLHVGVFNLCGLAAHEPFIAWAPARIDVKSRETYLEAFVHRLRGLENEKTLPMHTIADHPDPMDGKPVFSRL